MEPRSAAGEADALTTRPRRPCTHTAEGARKVEKISYPHLRRSLVLPVVCLKASVTM